MSDSKNELKARRYLRRLLRHAHREDSVKAVIVLGSVARATQVRPMSDLDVLVVGEGEVPRPPAGVQVSVLTKDALAQRAAGGDDFAQWALRFGRPLAGEEVYRQLGKEILPLARWPEPAVSLSRAQGRLDDAHELWDMGDLEAAREETRYALSHLARASLLASGNFPLSRPELPAQLREIGDQELAAALETMFEQDEPVPNQLEAALTVADGRLIWLRDPRFAPSLRQPSTES